MGEGVSNINIAYGIDPNGDSRRKSGRLEITRLLGYVESGKRRDSRFKISGLANVKWRYVTRISMLLVICAVAVVGPVTYLTKGPPATALSRDPPDGIYSVIGYTYYYDDVTLLPGCDVTVTDWNTGESLVTASDATYAYYEVNLDMLPSGWNNGDLVQVTAMKGTDIGMNESTVLITKPYTWINVTMQTTIPEFPAVLFPVVGFVLVMAVIEQRRKGG